MRRLLFPAVLALAAGAATSAVGQMGYGSYNNNSFNSLSTRMHHDDYETGKQLVRHEKYAEAIPYLNRAAEARPSDTEVLGELGYAYRMVGAYPASASWLQKALLADPDNRGAHENLGEVDLEMRDPASARGQLAELARICPSGCDERDALTKSVDTWAAANPAPAAMPAAAPSTPAVPAAATPAPGGH